MNQEKIHKLLFIIVAAIGITATIITLVAIIFENAKHTDVETPYPHPSVGTQP